MRGPRSSLDDARGGANVTSEDGRIEMSGDGDVRVIIEAMGRTPLSLGEQHATVSLYGDGFSATLRLDGRELDGLADAVDEIQDYYTTDE